MYGALFKNNFGDTIMDTEEFTYYGKASGPARLLTEIGTSPDYQGSFLETTNLWLSQGTEKCFMRTFWAANTLTHVGSTYGASPARKQVFRPNPRFELDDLCFWQPGTIGIYWMAEHYSSVDFTPYNGIGVWTKGSSFWCARPSDTIPNWMILSPTRQTVSDSVGMQLRNAANQITFDSRQNLVAIDYSQIITSAQIQNVLENNATITITLPKAIPNCYINSPVWRSFYRENAAVNVSTTVRVPIIKQTNSTTLTITRHIMPAENTSNIWNSSRDAIDSLAWNGAPGPGAFQSYYFDTPLFVSAGIL